MDAKIKGTKQNDVLGRKEVTVTISFDKGTPNRKEIKELVAGKLGANPARMSSMIRCGSSVRGLSLVTTIRSAPSTA